MPDLQNFSITANSAVNVTVPRFTIAATIFDGPTVIADYTNGNELQFPAVLATLSVAQRRTLIDLLANTLIQMKAGIYNDV